MIIDDKHKFVIPHIPKCAGTYIARLLENYVHTSYLLSYSGAKYYVKDTVLEELLKKEDFNNGWLTHIELHDLKPSIVQNYRLILPIRHPISRMISHYCDVVLTQKVHKMNFTDFCRFHTEEFHPIHTISSKVDHAMQITMDYKGFDIVRVENLAEELGAALEGVGVEMGPAFREDIAVGKVTNIVDGQKKWLRKSKASFKQEVTEECVEHGLDKRIEHYERDLIQRFYE